MTDLEDMTLRELSARAQRQNEAQTKEDRTYNEWVRSVQNLVRRMARKREIPDEDYHAFRPYPNPDAHPAGCVRCGWPPNHPIHSRN